MPSGGRHMYDNRSGACAPPADQRASARVREDTVVMKITIWERYSVIRGREANTEFEDSGL